MAKYSLVDKAARALRETLPSNEVATLMESLKAEMQTRGEEMAKAKESSLDPFVPAATAQGHRATASDLQFEIDRLARIESALAERLTALTEAETRARQAADYQSAMAERDQLAIDIAANYPRIVAELVSLCERIEASDTRIRGVIGPRLESAEVIARGVSPAGGNERLAGFNGDATLRLPAPRHHPWGAAWPKPTHPQPAAEVAAMYAAFMPGATEQDA